MSHAIGGKGAPNPERERAPSAAAAAALMRRAIERARVYVVRVHRQDLCAGCHVLSELRFGYCYACVYPYLRARCRCGHDFSGHLEQLPADGAVCAGGSSLGTSRCACAIFQPANPFGDAVALALEKLDS